MPYQPKFFMKKYLILFILACLSALAVYYFIFIYKHTPEEPKVTITNNIIMEKVVAVGKLELVKFYIRDILEQTKENKYWFNAKVTLIITGEVAGCIDLRKIDSTDIVLTETDLTLTLPEPEICYSKIDHSKSKVYNMEHGEFQEAELIDSAYKAAERQIETAAVEMKITDQTKQNAEFVLRPLLESFTGKKVTLKFKD